ncbi:hypothetical protein [Cryobacterium zhongshanensis]|uniref:Uncharacterized protein n=1 Tax=Cryobacterium zhongshanensis TaxID=2928153 RepID=A0AA41QWS5_9MICO|nr:hypothetical protein [Cryobacterium zhongshanensis]MCI4659575.1 hypothetical protein [Cryobacterium zhongshanensis]
MATVTQRIKQVTQPRGGYVNPRAMSWMQLGDGTPQLLNHRAENVSPAAVGTAVDYLSRLANGAAPEDAFLISIEGAVRLHLSEVLSTLDISRLTPVLDVGYLRDETATQEMVHVVDVLTQLKSLRPGVIPDDDAIRAAVHLVGYDIAYRRGAGSYFGEHTPPDAVTTAHIRTMVERAVAFFTKFGPVTEDGFLPVNRLSKTTLVDSGDGDFLTADTLWDFKVSVAPPTAVHTLQLLMYLLMGLRSGQEQYGQIEYIGIFNPRLNIVYRLAFADVSADVVRAVSHEVIGYK